MEKDIDFSLIGRRIREVRVQRGMTQAQLAFDAGMQHSYVCHIEKGEKQVSLKALVAIAEALLIYRKRTRGKRERATVGKPRGRFAKNAVL
jgi:transcriptional regulator with XRE-family HTH domain